MPIWSVYFCDLTGDGKLELCSTLSIGSGIVNDQILVYDYADGTGYDLSDRGNFDYILTVQEDSLIAEKGLIRRMRSLSPASWCCWMAFFR